MLHAASRGSGSGALGNLTTGTATHSDCKQWLNVGSLRQIRVEARLWGDRQVTGRLLRPGAAPDSKFRVFNPGPAT